MIVCNKTHHFQPIGMAQNLDSFLAVTLSPSSSGEWSTSEENDEPERKKRKLNEADAQIITVQFVEHSNTLSAVSENLWTVSAYLVSFKIFDRNFSSCDCILILFFKLTYSCNIQLSCCKIHCLDG